MALLVGGPLSGQHRDMPEDEIFTRVPLPSGRFAPYALARVTKDGEQHEVWGWGPWCYRKVKMVFLAMED